MSDTTQPPLIHLPLPFTSTDPRCVVFRRFLASSGLDPNGDAVEVGDPVVSRRMDQSGGRTVSVRADLSLLGWVANLDAPAYDHEGQLRFGRRVRQLLAALTADPALLSELQTLGRIPDAGGMVTAMMAARKLLPKPD